MLLELRESPLSDFPGYKLVQSDTYMAEVVFSFYRNPLNGAHGCPIVLEHITKSLRHFRGIQKALYDPKGRKFRILHWIEKKLLKSPYLFSSMITLPQEDTYDILNTQHRNWQHPCTGEWHNDSFFELFSEALALAELVLSELVAFLNHGDPSEVLQLINNRSFETGLSEAKSMKYFAPVYEKS